MDKDSSHGALTYRTLLAVLAVLLCLTAITVGAATIDLGAANIWIALGIASIKASLVLLFFMHLKFEPSLIRYSFLATVGFLAILIGFLFWDIAFR
ncbi:MAG: cytochrome C oxidase subunit IV family protein [Pseudomonadota bacterium]